MTQQAYRYVSSSSWPHQVGGTGKERVVMGTEFSIAVGVHDVISHLICIFYTF